MKPSIDVKKSIPYFFAALSLSLLILYFRTVVKVILLEGKDKNSDYKHTTIEYV